MNMSVAAVALTAVGAISGIPATANAAEASVPARSSVPSATLDLVSSDIDFTAAARAEAMDAPTAGYRISARFGQSGSMWSSGHHTGLDFVAPQGRGVDAADSGKVVSAGPAGAYGNLVEIVHGDGIRTRYAHLSSIDVKKGQHVARGEHIGAVGSTGNSSGPHVHFEVLVRGEQVNPQKFLNL